jgi:hypothetical protein
MNKFVLTVSDTGANSVEKGGKVIEYGRYLRIFKESVCLLWMYFPEIFLTTLRENTKTIDGIACCRLNAKT